jgi:hypothetical protein
MRRKTGRQDLADRPRVLRHQVVGGEQANPFDDRLRDQQPVERILVDRRELVDRHRVLAGHGQFAVAIVQQPATKQPRIDREIVPAKCVLDCDFPQARGTEEKFIVRIGNELAGLP